MNQPISPQVNFTTKTSKTDSPHLAALSNGACHNGGRSGSEGKLEKPESILCQVHIHEKVKPPSTNKGNSGIRAETVSVIAIGKCVPNSPEANGSPASIKKILEHDIVHILATNAPCTQHGKPGLHKEDQRAAKYQPECCHGQSQVLVCRLPGGKM